VLTYDTFITRMAEAMTPEFEALYLEYHKYLIGLAYNIVRDKDSAKDIVQEVFAKLWRNRETLQFGDQIKHYLFKATSHTSLNYLRSQRKIYRIEDFERIKDIASSAGTETASFKELELRSRQAIDRLPPQCKMIFLLSRQEGLKYHEIADTLGLSVKTIENQMGIALEKLRRDLKPFLSIEFIGFLIALAALLYRCFS
jgi:RNA polymerase sigma-70 factor (ECF subfamily)